MTPPAARTPPAMKAIVDTLPALTASLRRPTPVESHWLAPPKLAPQWPLLALEFFDSASAPEDAADDEPRDAHAADDEPHGLERRRRGRRSPRRCRRRRRVRQRRRPRRERCRPARRPALRRGRWCSCPRPRCPASRVHVFLPGALASIVCLPGSTATCVPHCPSRTASPSRFTTRPATRTAAGTSMTSCESLGSSALARSRATRSRSAALGPPFLCSVAARSRNVVHALAVRPTRS